MAKNRRHYLPGTIYKNGNITTDDNGFATVEMPDYFESLNRDFHLERDNLIN